MKIVIKYQTAITIALICAFISLNTHAYGLNLGNVYEEEKYASIIELEDNIISDLYNSSLSEPEEKSSAHTSSINFELAQKAYVFSPENFLNAVAREDFSGTYTENSQLVWRVPVEVSVDTCDYAIIGQKDDGTYSYTTARIPKENLDSVRYLFEPDVVFSEIEKTVGDGIILDVISIPRYGLDLLMMENRGSLFFVSLSTQFDGLKRDQVYSTDDIIKQVELLLLHDAATEDAGGSGAVQKDDGWGIVVLLAMATLLGVYLCFLQWRKVKEKTG